MNKSNQQPIDSKLFRKIPALVRAVQWKGDNRMEIEQFVGQPLQCHVPPAVMEKELNIPNQGYTIIIPTREGNLTALRMDWIIEGVSDEHGKHYWVNKPDYFKKAYEPVGSTIDSKEGEIPELFETEEDALLYLKQTMQAYRHELIAARQQISDQGREISQLQERLKEAESQLLPRWIDAFEELPDYGYRVHIKYAECGEEHGRYDFREWIEETMQYEKDHPILWLKEPVDFQYNDEIAALKQSHALMKAEADRWRGKCEILQRQINTHLQALKVCRDALIEAGLEYGAEPITDYLKKFE